VSIDGNRPTVTHTNVRKETTIMANDVTEVVLSIEVKLPGSNAIRLEEVLVHGAGTLSEVLNGGTSTYGLTLTSGTERRELKKGEAVFVQGLRDGAPFKLPAALDTTQTHRPWKFGSNNA
jgi:hypothetical protein